MTPSHLPTGCTSCPISRRRFLATGCAACAGATGLVLAKTSVAATDQACSPVRIRIIHALHAVKQPKADWPNIGFDFQPVMDQLACELKARCPGFEFLTSMAAGPEEAQKILEADKDANIDGYLVYQLNPWNKIVQPVAATGKPTLFVDFPYGGSGGLLIYSARFLAEKASNVGFVSSSQMADIVAAVECFVAKKSHPDASFAALTAEVRRQRTPTACNSSCVSDPVTAISPQECLAKMKQAKILAVTGQTGPLGEAIAQQMGIAVVTLPFAELNDAWAAADKDQAREIADRWQKSASAIADVSRETLEKSAAMYLGQKTLLKKHGANAITINCLGGFYGGHIHAYPCLGFHELNNEGLIGACEGDLRSTASMVAMTTLTQGRPGFISDPVIDTSKRQIIYAHCVASNKPFGPQGPANAFEILTHSEDRQGAAVRSLLPLNHITTTVEFEAGSKQVLFHQAKTVENVIDDRACRTKLAAEPVGDLEKLFTKWHDWGWHRVTVYGDLKAPVFALADALGWKVVEEA